MFGKLNYLAPIYSIANKDNLMKLHKIIMTAARVAIGDYCFKKSNDYILNKCKWYDIDKLILISSLNTIHKVITNDTPPSMTKYFKSRERLRKGNTIATNIIPLSVKFQNFYIYKYTKIYNKIDNSVRLKNPKGFKNEIKLMVSAGTISDSMD